MRTSVEPHQFPRPLRRHRLHRGFATSMGLALAVTSFGAAGAATEVTLKNPGQLTTVGPVNTDHGFPAWYEDSSGTRTELCLDATNPLCGIAPEDVPDPSQPISFPENFPGEAFYQLAGAELELPGGGRAVLVLALEAAFANEIAQRGDQVVFARVRVTTDGAPPNATLSFTHPYGQLTVDTDAEGHAKLVEDISPAIGNFGTPLMGNVGPFLKWDPAVAPAAPEGYLGDPEVEHAVVGSPFGTNVFAVTGGGVQVSTDQFSLMGKISTNTGVHADQAVVNGNFLDVFATSEGTQIQVDGQAGSFEATPMVTDPGSNRFYARIPFTGEAPTSVRVTNVGDDPASSSTVQVSRPVGITILDASYDGASLSVTARSATGQALTLEGYGALTAKAGQTNVFEGTFPTAAPPASVTVTTADGRASVPVIVTGGPATPTDQPPIDPAPVDPAPVDPAPVDPAPVDPAPVAAFVDVPATHVFATEIAWMAQNGISGGWATTGGQKEYRPGAATTREAMAAFLYRMAGSPAYTPPAVSPFADVPTSHVFYEEIAWMAEQDISGGWATGTGTKEYRPGADVTREAMAAFLYRMAGSPAYTPPAVSPFADVPTSHEFYDEIAWMADNGISGGWATAVGTKEYRPAVAVTRDVMAAFLHRLGAVL